MTQNDRVHFHKSLDGAANAFEQWRRDHVDEGFFLNLQSAKRAMLHRADCQHYKGNMTAEQMVSSEKVCSTNKAGLKIWGRSTGRELRECECI